MKKRYFTAKKNKNKHTIEGTVLKPTPATLMSKPFEGAYRAQLDRILFGADEIDPSAMHNIMALTEWVDQGVYPVCLIGNLQPDKFRVVVHTLNNLYEEHGDLLLSLYRMYVGKLNDERAALLKRAIKPELRGLDTGVITTVL